MKRMFTLEFAKLHLLKTTGSVAFFFGRRVVAPFALGAFQNNQFAHVFKLSLGVDISPEPSLQAARELYRFENSAA